MSFKCCQFVIILLVAIELSAASRERRSDDGAPLEVVVEHLSQQVTHLNSQVAALKTKTGTSGFELVAIKRNIVTSFGDDDDDDDDDDGGDDDDKNKKKKSKNKNN